MKIYTVHLRRGADPIFTPDRDAVFLREGFNWWAFLAPLIWVLATRQWLVSAAVWGGWIVLALVLGVSGFDPASSLIVQLGVQLALGFALSGVVAADDSLAAEKRYFEQGPLASSLHPGGAAA
jgi:hypothetical protein